MRKICAAQLFLFLAAIFAVAQPAAKVSLERSLNVLTAADHFSSVAGRFAIALPKDTGVFTAVTPAAAGENVSGGSYKWRLREGIVVINYFDYLDPDFSVTTELDFTDFFNGAKAGVVSSTNGRIVSERSASLNGNRGAAFVLLLPNTVRAIARVYYVDKRNYTLIAFVANGVAGAESSLTRALDTFTLISPSKFDAEKLNDINVSGPAVLPQWPIARRERSDADDENLKGDVRTVVAEDQDLSGTWSNQARHFASIEDFNEGGNLVKRVSFNSRGAPSEVALYGYINGARASKSQTIGNDGDPPPPVAVASAARTRDTRYSFLYRYTYLKGQLAEMQMTLNDGIPGMRYTYARSGYMVEKLAYDYDGKLNQKYLIKFDNDGNEIEQTNVDVLPGKKFGDRKYSYRYESFDKKGNWTTRTTYKLVTENGNEYLKPWYTTFRTIVYFA